MNQIIKSAKELGIDRGGDYILRVCDDCNSKKWIPIYNKLKKNHSGLCKKCSARLYSGKNSPNWRGGMTLTTMGYLMINSVNHPLARKNGSILVHRLIACEEWGIEAVMGMDVHHINGDKTDNRIENLEILSHPDHTIMNNRKRAEERHREINTESD